MKDNVNAALAILFIFLFGAMMHHFRSGGEHTLIFLVSLGLLMVVMMNTSQRDT